MPEDTKQDVGTMECKDFLALVRAYGRGELDPDTRARFVAHGQYNTCRSCYRSLEIEKAGAIGIP